MQCVQLVHVAQPVRGLLVMQDLHDSRRAVRTCEVASLCLIEGNAGGFTDKFGTKYPLQRA